MKSIRDIFRSYGVLDAEGRHVNGTDKQTNHNYGDAYESLFPDRAAVKLMMEVGIADGSSLLAWRDIFPNAVCVGLDIMPNPISMLHDKERVEFYVGDMRSSNDCHLATHGRLFDFICEDATHNLSDTLLAVENLWPSVRPGGIYVIEEFANVLSHKRFIAERWPFAEIVDTLGPFGGTEPLVVLRKPT